MQFSPCSVNRTDSNYSEVSGDGNKKDAEDEKDGDNYDEEEEEEQEEQEEQEEHDNGNKQRLAFQ